MTVTGENISMTRGDSETLTVSCDRPFVNGDVVEMTVRKTATSDEEMYKRVEEFTLDGKAIIEINTEDTEDMAFGSHLYDVQLTTYDGKVITIIKPHTFYLDKEITYGRNTRQD